MNLGKISGNYQVSLVHKEVDDKYDQNDLGYQEKNNEFNFYCNQSYNVYQPFWIINKMSNDIGIDYLMLYAPRAYRIFNMDYNLDIDFKNYFTLGVLGGMRPFKKNYDYYEPRTVGRYYIFKDNYYFGNYFSTDYRKKFALDGNYDAHLYAGSDRRNFSYSFGPRYRFSDRLTIKFIYNNEMLHDDPGFVDNTIDSIIFGVRNINTITNEINLRYSFTNSMSLSFRVRHYWSKVKYDRYFGLTDDGMEAPTSYSVSNDIDFNAFNVDMVYTWQFAPGSEMSIVWKNSIYKQESVLAKKYFESLNKTIDSPQNNSFSIKLLYYLDYQYVKHSLGKNKK